MGLRVVVAGGGTAGHVEPAMNLADELMARDTATVVTALGTVGGLEARLVPERGYELDLIERVPLPRKPSRDLITLPRRLRAATGQCREAMDRRAADVVVGFGGYVALPAYLAARRRVPLVIHEANARAGLANRVGARFTPHVAEAFAGSLRGAVRIGIPLRPAIALLDRPGQQSSARSELGLAPEAPCLLVFGGSQGARSLNAATVAALPALVDAGIQVLHAYGEKNADQIDPVRGTPGYVPVAYINHMDRAYSAADLAVCRAGAVTCAEVSAVGLPAVFVPLPIGNGEQRLNAQPIVDAGGGVLIDDADLDGARLGEVATGILCDDRALADLGQRAASVGVRDASARLADMVQRAAKEGL